MEGKRGLKVQKLCRSPPSRNPPPDFSDAGSGEVMMYSAGALIAPSILWGAMKTIARLNDEFRSTCEDGRVFLTPAVQALSVDIRAAAIVAVQAHMAFTKDNDPYDEHDCASFELDGERFVWTIDYYDETCTYRSKDPCDPDVTTRVLTLMLAADY